MHTAFSLTAEFLVEAPGHWANGAMRRDFGVVICPLPGEVVCSCEVVYSMLHVQLGLEAREHELVKLCTWLYWLSVAILHKSCYIYMVLRGGLPRKAPDRQRGVQRAA